MRKTVEHTNSPPPFETYFQAETFLEKRGFTCQEEVWRDKDNHIATVAPKNNGVVVEFKH